MHFEILVEGQAELTTLSIIMNQILGDYGQDHTWRIHKHRGIGRIPLDPAANPNKHDPTLLHNLPSRLRAYGDEGRDDVVVVVLVDLDARLDCKAFKSDLVSLLSYCQQKPKVLFRIAIEELEAWFFGDQKATKLAYPAFRQQVLDDYVQDSQCGTWEKLADAIYPGGLRALGQHGKRSVRILEQKRIWAKEICRYFDVQINQSPSFKAFRDGLLKMATT